ncbi:MAG TPA: hypothetical protein VEK08_14115 [Planctomycetota bacterium]|nr:hypothetical protein [Planctomycetota bacterium]
MIQLTESDAKNILSDQSLCRRCEKEGIDLGLLIENLMLPPEMRFKRHQNALRMALAFKDAGERARRSS